MTQPDVNRDAPPSGGRPEGPLERTWRLVVEGFAAIGTVLIGVLMIIICADIIARNLMGSSLPLVSEAGALLLVMLVALQLGATVRTGRLASTEIFITPFTERFPLAGAILSACFSLIGAAMLGLIAWATIRILEKDYASAEFIGVTGIATLPTWPFRFLILLGFTVAAIEFLVRVVVALGAAWRARK